MTFPGLWNFLPPKIPPGMGAHLFRYEPFTDLSTYACQICSRSGGRVEKGGGTDRQAHKGILQLYIVVAASKRVEYDDVWVAIMIMVYIELAGYPASLGPLPPSHPHPRSLPSVPS